MAKSKDEIEVIPTWRRIESRFLLPIESEEVEEQKEEEEEDTEDEQD